MNERHLELYPEKGPPAETKTGEEVKAAEEQVRVAEKSLEKMSKSELLEKVQELMAISDKNYDLYLRSQAEIENMKKRNKKDKEEWLKYANETLIKDLLPAMDSLEDAISHSNNENALRALREGVELTLKGLKNSLSKSGLEEIKADGVPFDPGFHEAVSMVEDDRKEAGTVLCEVQKGYVLNKRLIRPARVVVSKGKPTGVSHGNDSERACEKP